MAKDENIMAKQASLGVQDPHVRLAGAVLLQAVEAAADGDPEARTWLLEDDALLYAELASLDPLPVTRWVADGCPMKPKIRRSLERR